MPYPSKTVTVSISCPADRVYAFVSDPSNLPKWAPAFAKSVRKTEGKWVIETDQGSVGIRMTPANAFGVADHFIAPPAGKELYVPMRVIPNADGCEVTFTLFKTDEMTEQRYQADLAFVRRDLDSLKAVMEK